LIVRYLGAAHPSQSLEILLTLLFRAMNPDAAQYVPVKQGATITLECFVDGDVTVTFKKGTDDVSTEY